MTFENTDNAPSPDVEAGFQPARGCAAYAAATGMRVLALAVLMALPAFAQHVHNPGAPQAAAAPKAERTILFWYDPMHPQVRSDKPGPSPDHCGMDLVPMYADEGEGRGGAPGGVHISPSRQQITGVRTAAVTRRTLTRAIRTVGIVQADETRVRKVHTKFPGWIESVLINFTGQPVRSGDPILTIYSPDLVSTQAEYLLAWRGEQQLQGSQFAEAASNSQMLLDASRRRLSLWGITPQQIKALRERGTPQTAVTLQSPASGYVTVKDVYAGLYVTPEMELYAVTDLSRVWVVLDVYEYEMANVRLNTPVTLRLAYYPGETFTGTAISA